GVAIQSDGKIVVAGSTTIGGNTDIALARLAAVGGFDFSFGQSGLLRTDFDSTTDIGTDVVIQPNGQKIVAGRTNSAGNTDLALVRYLANGSPESTFGSFGKVKTDFGSNNDQVLDISLQADGSIVAAGHTRPGGQYDFAVARYIGDANSPQTFVVDTLVD